MSKEALIPPIHRRHYIQHKILGQSLEEIASREKCSVKHVERSIEQFEIFQAVYSVEQVVIGQAAIVLKNVELEQRVLASALEAKRSVIVRRDGQEVLEESDVPDHETRLHAVEIINKKIESIMPKGGGISISQNVSNQVSAPSITMSFEDRLRQIKEKRDNLLLEAKPIEVTEDPIPAGS